MRSEFDVVDGHFLRPVVPEDRTMVHQELDRY